MRRLIRLAIGLALTLLLAAPSALAQERGVDPADDQRARELYLNGVELFDEGEYALAIEAFEASYDLSRRPDLLFNISTSWERLGDPEAALEALNRYRVFAEPGEKEELRRRKEYLRELIDREAAAASDDGEDEVDTMLELGRGEPAPGARAQARPGAAGPTLMIAGGAVGGGFAVVAGVSYSRALAHREVGDQDGWEQVRPLNNASLVLAGVGAATFTAGLIVAAVEGGRTGRPARVRVVPAVVPLEQGGMATLHVQLPARQAKGR